MVWFDQLKLNYYDLVRWITENKCNKPQQAESNKYLR